MHVLFSVSFNNLKIYINQLSDKIGVALTLKSLRQNTSKDKTEIKKTHSKASISCPTKCFISKISK